MGGWDYNDGWIMAMDYTYQLAILDYGYGWMIRLWTGIGWIILWLLWLDYGYGLWIILDYTMVKTYNVVKTC